MLSVYTCVSVYIHVTYTKTRERNAHIHMHIKMHAYIYIYIYIYIHPYARLYICVCVCTRYTQHSKNTDIYTPYVTNEAHTVKNAYTCSIKNHMHDARHKIATYNDSYIHIHTYTTPQTHHGGIRQGKRRIAQTH
jgi:hypothetical protein